MTREKLNSAEPTDSQSKTAADGTGGDRSLGTVVASLAIAALSMVVGAAASTASVFVLSHVLYENPDLFMLLPGLLAGAIVGLITRADRPWHGVPRAVAALVGGFVIGAMIVGGVSLISLLLDAVKVPFVGF